jgi:predicted metal-dependent hydrolase
LAEGHSFGLDEFDFRTPIDPGRWWVCPTLTPLYYAPCYGELSEAQARRYNQITALSFGELFGFFETVFERALRGVLEARSGKPLCGEIRACVEGFIREEAKHREMWWRLAALSEPTWYDNGPMRVVRIPAVTRRALSWLTARPDWFPAVVWAILALEEHSMEISRRCARVPAERIEPRYAAVYRAHMAEEARHVQIDWHLLVHLMEGIGPVMRRVNGWVFRAAVGAFFMRPTRAAVRVLDVLVGEAPELRISQRRMVRELKALDRDERFRRMMLSPESTPVTFRLMERYPELRV